MPRGADIISDSARRTPRSQRTPAKSRSELPRRINGYLFFLPASAIPSGQPFTNSAQRGLLRMREMHSGILRDRLRNADSEKSLFHTNVQTPSPERPEQASDGFLETADPFSAICPGNFLKIRPFFHTNVQTPRRSVRQRGSPCRQRRFENPIPKAESTA